MREPTLDADALADVAAGILDTDRFQRVLRGDGERSGEATAGPQTRAARGGP
jgi:hypothetical protein